MTHQGVRVRAVPVTSVFAYERAASGYRLAKSRGGAHAALYDAVVGAEQSLCEVGTGVSVSQSLKPSAQGAGLLYQAGCKLLVADVAGVVKGVALICSYETGEQLIEPRQFGDATDDYVRSQPDASALMLELICARGPATADARNANYLAAKALIAALKRFAQQRSYDAIVAKAENARSREFLRRRGFAILFQRGNPAAMQVATSDLTV